MRYLSVCSGIEAATVAWHPLGWEAAAFSEIEPFPRAVLAHHFPDVPLHGDFTTIEGNEYGSVDLLVGGTPCQSFSVAGLRGGLDDERGQLALQFLKLLDRTRARWVVWENVPGVLSSNGGRDFGAFLGGLVELGYGFAYRVLDAQHFGVPQRRRRVFVVGHLGDWRRAAAVLFERHSLSGHPAPRRETREGTAAGSSYGISPDCFDRSGEGAGGTAGERSGLGVDQEVAYSLRAKRPGAVAHCPTISPALKSRDFKGPSSDSDGDGDGAPLIAHSLRAEDFDASEDGTGRGTPLVPVHAIQSVNTPREKKQNGIGVRDAGAMYSLTARDQHAVCFTAKDHGADASDIAPTPRAGGHSGSHANAGVMSAVAFTASEQANSYAWERDVYPTLNAQIPNDTSNIQQGVRLGSAVRRLTPRECERLQGFPDDFTLVPYRGKPAADGPRYKALGNSMAVPVVRWIGERINAVESRAILAAEMAA